MELDNNNFIELYKNKKRKCITTCRCANLKAVIIFEAREMLMKEPFEMHCGYSVAAFFGSWTNSREVLSSSAAVGV